MIMNLFKSKETKNDFIISIITGGVFIAIIHLFDLNFIFNNLFDSLDSILTISVTLAGFLITSLTILFVFPENSRIKFIKTHPTYKYIFHAFILSIILFIAITVLSLVFKMLTPHIPSFLLSVLIILFIWSIVSLFRCLWLLKRLIDIYFFKSEGSSK